MNASWLDTLNPAQREAVTHGDGPLLVVAGAGTGKTKTLACRVAYLIQQGASPERILLLTFTRRAAAEMVRRAEEMTGHSSTGRVWGGTFHAMANRLLRIYGSALNISPDFTVMDQGDAADMMNMIRGELGVAKNDRRFPRKETLVSIYSRTVNAQEKLDRVLARQFPWCRDEIEGIAAIFEAYTKRKRESNVFDYDDLLLVWMALCESPGAGDAMGDRFDHVLVDEYQDTNPIQSRILLGLRRTRKNIMVVGDDAQSIYSFRAATVRNILDFPRHFTGARVVTLEQNYRSTQPILAASNAVMAAAKERFTKNLRSDRASHQRPILITCMDDQQQCKSVVRRIITHLEQGIPLMRQAVLFRAAHHSDRLEVELARCKIPFHKFGGLKFVEAAHIKDLLALLRILENPFDELSWYRVLQMLEGIGPASAQRIINELGIRQPRAQRDRPPPGHDGPAIAVPLRTLFGRPPRVPQAAREQFIELRAALADCSGVDLSAIVPEASADAGENRRIAPPLVSQVERLRRFYEPIFEKRYENPTIRLRDIEQLEQIAGTYRSRTSFVTDLTLDPPSSTSDLAGPPHLDEDWLTLSTVHSAKGCEWDVVHIIHAADGMMPSDMALSDAAGEEEERRLFYVAMTRAKDWLYVYFPLRYYFRKHAMGDGHSLAQVSRFLSPTVRRFFAEEAADGDVQGFVDAHDRGLSGVDESLTRLWMDS